MFEIQNVCFTVQFYEVDLVASAKSALPSLLRFCASAESWLLLDISPNEKLSEMMT